MPPYRSVLLFPLIFLTIQSYSLRSERFLIHLDFGTNRTARRPSVYRGRIDGVLATAQCSEVTFPTGTYCDFSISYENTYKRFPDLNFAESLVLVFLHPHYEDTVCEMTFFGQWYEIPARAVYAHYSCMPEVDDKTIPPARMSDVGLMKLHYPSHTPSSIEIYSDPIIVNSRRGRINKHPVVGFFKRGIGYWKSFALGRPYDFEAQPVAFSDLIRERPMDD